MTETGRGSDSIAVKTLLKNPEIIGKAVGFKDLTKMHGDWIHQMVYGKGDYTLQAHRGSYKSSCLAVAIAMMMVIYPKRNIIFLRKTDDDVAEMMRMVAKILKSEMFQNLAFRLYGTDHGRHLQQGGPELPGGTGADQDAIRRAAEHPEPGRKDHQPGDAVAPA